MKVVHLCDTPLSAAPYRLMKVQLIAGLDVRLVSGTNMYPDKGAYWHDLVVLPDQLDEIRRVVEEADIIHLHNRYRKQRLFKHIDGLFEVVEKKPKVLQFHSPRYQLEADTPDSFTLKCTKLVVAQYQVRQYPEAIPVPNAVPIDDPYHTPHDSWPERLTPLPHVVFAPSNTVGIKWDNKGYRETKRALEKLYHSHLIEFPEIITKTPLAEVCLHKKRADICIDEVMTGSYHLASLEALSMGTVAIANLDTQTVDALEMITGTRSHPWVVAHKENLYNRIAELSRDPDLLRQKKRDARRYMEVFWDPFRVTDIFRRIYESVIQSGVCPRP